MPTARPLPEWGKDLNDEESIRGPSCVSYCTTALSCPVPCSLGSAATEPPHAMPALLSQPTRLPSPLQPMHPRPYMQPFVRLQVARAHAAYGLLRSPGPCGCSTLHTQGHRAFVELLNDDIEEEMEIPKRNYLPKSSGSWELEVDGSEAKFLQKVAGEKITVAFHVDSSILPTLDGEEEPSKGRRLKNSLIDIHSQFCGRSCEDLWQEAPGAGLFLSRR